MEQLLTKWQAEADALFAEISSTEWDASTNRMTARKLARISQINACIADLIKAMEVQNG